MSNIVRLRTRSQKARAKNKMKNHEEAELTYRIAMLTEKVDDLDNDLKIANKMIKLLTLLLVSEKQDEAEELLEASKEHASSS